MKLTCDDKTVIVLLGLGGLLVFINYLVGGFG